MLGEKKLITLFGVVYVCGWIEGGSFRLLPALLGEGFEYTVHSSEDLRLKVNYRREACASSPYVCLPQLIMVCL